MKLQKKDFIEIEFTGKVKDGNIFDSNIKDDLKKANLGLDAKPFIFCLGEGMFIKGVEDFLLEKDLGEYEIELKPDDAFGNRDSKLIQMIPIKFFWEHKLNPVQGGLYNFDGRLAKALTVSGGRVMTDFNHPLSGKVVVYKIRVIRKVEDLNEKIKSLNEFFFKKDFKFEITEKKLVLEVEKQMAKFVEMFREKYKELLELNLEVKEIERKK